MADVLVIEDDEKIRTFLARALGEEGHEVRLARNGVQGIALFREKPAEVVITDIYMPEMDGLETVRKLRLMSTAVRIIAISGGGIMRHDCLGAATTFGAFRVLAKPFSPSDIVAAVRDALARCDKGE